MKQRKAVNIFSKNKTRLPILTVFIQYSTRNFTGALRQEKEI
jgi:hypothetical protein